MSSKHLVLVAALLALSACAKKDGPSCAVSDSLPRPMLEGPTRDEPRRLTATGSYVLAVTWSPEYCASRSTSPADRLQCGGQAGSFGFVLHGLWPQGKGEERPQYCKPARLIPDKILREHLCSTPSVQLMQHEWEKHGTCMYREPADYFAKSQPLYRALHYPDMAALRGKKMPAQAFEQAFAAANEGMKADQLRLSVSDDGWLKEVWVCLDRKFNRKTCPPQVGGAARTTSVRIR